MVKGRGRRGCQRSQAGSAGISQDGIPQYEAVFPLASVDAGGLFFVARH